MRRFGYLIASLSQSQANSGGVKFFEYDNRRALFIAHESQTTQDGHDLIDDVSRVKIEPIVTASILSETDKTTNSKQTSLQSSFKDDRKLQLMKSMAQLRLEVSL